MFGIDVMDASLAPAMLVALLAGLLSFLSPCVLPIVPPYLAYMAGTSVSSLNSPDSALRRQGVVVTAAFFVLGLSTVFMMLGLAASAIGQVLLEYQRALTVVSGVIIAIFGLHFLGVLHIPLLGREARFDAGDRGGSAAGAYVLGLAFAFGWTPCIGPVLGSVLALAAQEHSVARSLVLMALYAAGLGIPFLLTAIFLERSMSVMHLFKQHMGVIEKCTGALLLVVGILMATGVFSAFAFWLLETFPVLGSVG